MENERKQDTGRKICKEETMKEEEQERKEKRREKQKINKQKVWEIYIYIISRATKGKVTSN